MKRDNDIMNSIAKKKGTGLIEITGDIATALKQRLLEAYSVIAQFCEQNRLTIFLGGGSCLGAVRHHGFIPWDDDLDLNMPRKDYLKLIQLIEQGKFPSGFHFTYPSKDKDTTHQFLKIYIDNTELIEVNRVNDEFPKGIFIDIFPMENVPSNIIKRCLKGVIAEMLQFMSVSSFMFEHRNYNTEAYLSKDSVLWLRYKIRLFVGACVSLIGHKKIAYYTDKFVQRKKEGKYVTYPTGRKHFLGEILPRDVFLPVSTGMFEGLKVYLPNKPEVYLKNLYGESFMELPPVEKRERHFIVSIKL